MDQTQISAIPPGNCDRFVDETGRQNDGEMGTAMEADGDFAVGDLHVCGQVDEVAEDLARLCIFVAPVWSKNWNGGRTSSWYDVASLPKRRSWDHG